MTRARDLAALRHHLGDLQWKSRTLPGYGHAVMGREIARLTDEIAGLEIEMARPRRTATPAA
ncbi:MAG: hypothetical protein ACREEB_01440 [Caulobacteraceae bacterium]